MTLAETKEILKWHGFDVADNVPYVWYRDDQVGVFSEEILTLADYIPSMIGVDYRSVNKTIININHVDAKERILVQIVRLYETQKRWEEHLRTSRIERMRKYFNKLKDANIILNQKQFDYSKLPHTKQPYSKIPYSKIPYTRFIEEHIK